MSTCQAIPCGVGRFFRRTRLSGLVLSCAAGWLLVVGRPVSADTFRFQPVGVSTDWNDPNNWLDLNTNTTGALPGSVSATDVADVDNNLTATITGPLTNDTMQRAYIGGDGQNIPTTVPPTPPSTGNGTLNHSAGQLNMAGANNWFRVGQNAGQTGTYNMTGTADLESPNDTIRIGENGTGIMTMTDNTILNNVTRGGLVVADNGTGTFTISGNAVANIHDLHVADGGAGVGVMNINGGTINNPNGDADIGRGGHGTVNQIAGTVNLQTNGGNWSAIGRDGGVGVYNLSGGNVVSNHWLLVGRGNAASNGTFNISNTGTFTTRSLWISQQDSTGVVNQTGGTVNVGPAYFGGGGNGNFRVGFDNGHGTYNMMAGVLNDVSGTVFPGVTNKNQTQSMDIADGGHDGTFNQTGGTVNTNWIRNGNGGGGTGIYNISGTLASPSTLNASRIMAGTTGNGNGTYNQTSANTTVNVDNDVSIGDSGGRGTYNISAGVLNSTMTAPYNEDGSGRPGGFTTDVPPKLANGGGTATGNESIQIGWNATGTFNQTGGTVNAINSPIAADPNVVQGTVTSGVGFNGNNTASGQGTYNLSGGVLKTAAIFKVNDGGTGTFNFNGGTLRVNAAPTAALPIFMGPGNPDIVDNRPPLLATPGPAVHTKIEALTAANIQAGGAIIDTNGFNITISQPLLHDPGLGATPDGGLTLNDSSVGPAGILTLTGANTFNGITQINTNTLIVGNALALQNSTVNLTVANSVQFAPAIGAFTFGGLSGSANLPLQDSAPVPITLTVGNNNGSTSYTGILSAGGALIKAGAGTLTLTAAQSYSGPTTINGGTLNLPSTASLTATSAVTVGGAAATPGTFPTLNGSGTVNGAVTVNGAGGGDAGHLAPGANMIGNFGAIGTLPVGSLKLNGGSILDLDVGAPGSSDLIASTGALTLPTAGLGSVTVNLNNLGGFATGAYKIISEASTSNFTNTIFSIGVGVPGFQVAFSNPGGTEVDLIVSPAPTWKAIAADTHWENSANWVNGLIPGSTTGTTNTDLAAFTTASNILTPAPDAGRNVQNITFDQAAAGAYMIGGVTPGGGNALLLTTGGTIQTTALVTNTQTVNSPLVLEGANGTYTFSSRSSDNTKLLIIGGGVTGGAAGNTVLTLAGTNTGANAVNGVIANGSATTLAVTKTGGGVWVLGGNNTFTGGVDVEQGTLRVGNAGALNSTTPSVVTFGPVSTGTFALNGISITINGLNSTSPTAQVINGNVAAATLTVNTLAASSFSGVLADGPGGGALNLVVSDAGLTLSGTNTFSGTTDVTGAATLTLASAGALQNSTLHLTVNNNVLFNTGVGTFTLGGLSGGANLKLQDTAAVPAAVTVNVGNNNGNSTYSGVLSGPGALTKVGTGTLTLPNANTYSGTTTITAGTLQLGDGAANNGSVASTSIVNNATLAFANPNAQTHAGAISGTGAVTKTGAGTLTLTGGSTYAGGTTISAGRVNVGPFAPSTTSSPIGTGTVTLTGTNPVLGLRGVQTSGPGLLAQFYNSAPANVGNQDPAYNALTTMNAKLDALTPTVVTTTVANGKADLNFTSGGALGPTGFTGGGNRDYIFNKAGPDTALYGFGVPTTTTGLDNFQVRMSGSINITNADTYTFTTTSDDGSVLFIDGGDGVTPNDDIPLVNNNKYQGMTVVSGSVALTAGLHTVSIGFYEGGGGLGLGATYQSSLATGDTGGAMVAIPNSVLSYNTSINSQTYSNNVVVATNSTIDIANALTASVGGLSIGAVTLNVASSDATASPYSLTFNGATTLTGNGTINVANSTGGGAGTVTLAAVNQGVGGPFGLTKGGPGLLVLSAVGNYAGGTTISGGTVQANVPGSLGTGSVTINNGTTLKAIASNPSISAVISGFSNGTGWTVTSGGTGVNDPPFSGGGNTLTLTNLNNDESRSVFFNTVQPIVQGNKGFGVKFTYTDVGGGGADGITFCLQNDARGAAALGGGGGALGYGAAPQITPSGAMEINVYNGHPIGTQLLQGGVVVDSHLTGAVNVGSGDPINVVLGYDPISQTVSETDTDATTGASYTQVYASGDLTAIVGGSTAFIGFTGATGGANALQKITNFSYGLFTGSPYGNNLVVPGGATSKVDITPMTLSPTVTMGTLTVGAAGTLTKVNTGTLEVTGAANLANGASILVNVGGMKFTNTSAAATIGTGVTVTVAAGATVELAGTVSNLSAPSPVASRAHVINNSTSTLLVSGTHQQVGAIDGIGNTVVNAGGDLTANHIIQNSLEIDGTATSAGIVTIAASDALGNPTASSLALAGSLAPSGPYGAGSTSSSSLPAVGGPSGMGSTPGALNVGGSATVPEPSSIVLIALGSLVCLLPALRRRKARKA